MVLQSLDYTTFAKPRGLRGLNTLQSVGSGAGLQPGAGECVCHDELGQGAWCSWLEWLTQQQDAGRTLLPALTRISGILGPGVAGRWM